MDSQGIHITEINTSEFVDELIAKGVRRIAGVPCSFLGPLINEAQNRGIYEPFVNEGDALAYAAGASLAGYRCAVVMQNSGLSNAISPLTSLNELFGLHTLLIIGNRGVGDEPQHRIMAGAVKPFLNTMEIPYFDAEAPGALADAWAQMDRHCAALLVNSRNTFTPVSLTSSVSGQTQLPGRYELLEAVAECAGDSMVVTATGFTSREMYCIKDRVQNFYMVGSMGCLSSLAAGIAEHMPGKTVIGIDGDSACLMRLGALYTLTQKKPSNLCYLVLDNGVNESTGGQPNSLGSSRLPDVMNALHPTGEIRSVEELKAALEHFRETPVYTQMHAAIKTGTMKGLPRPDRQLIYDQAKRFWRSGGL